MNSTEADTTSFAIALCRGETRGEPERMRSTLRVVATLPGQTVTPNDGVSLWIRFGEQSAALYREGRRLEVSVAPKDEGLSVSGADVARAFVAFGVDLRTAERKALGNAEFLATAAAWHQDPSLARLARSGGRRFIVSALGEHDGEWQDGPLAHLLADGSLASYLPGGGPGYLRVPLSLTAGLQGRPLADAEATEGDLGERARRSLLARVDARLDSSAASETYHFTFDAPLLHGAVTLALIRTARPEARIAVAASEATPTFKRFCQNAGIKLHMGKGATSGWTKLSTIGSAVPESWVAVLAQALNRRSELIPASLAKSELSLRR